MVLADHNGYIRQIQRPAIPADPGLGIEGSDGEVRWSGWVQAHDEQNIVQEIRGGGVVVVDQRVIQVPANIPVIPDTGDMVTFRDLWGGTTILKVFKVNETDRQFGKLSITFRLS